MNVYSILTDFCTALSPEVLTELLMFKICILDIRNIYICRIPDIEQ
jgi:hypothetical protein